MSQAFNHNSIETDLQVRLMNLVMGEASDFERDQLQSMMEQRPELAAYYQHLAHLHGLLCDIGSDEPSLDADPSVTDDAWQLSADRRAKVLAVLDNQSPKAADKVTLAKTVESKYWRVTFVEAFIAASIACVLLGLLLPATQSARESARRFSADIRAGTVLTYEVDGERSIAQGLPPVASQPFSTMPSDSGMDPTVFYSREADPSGGKPSDSNGPTNRYDYIAPDSNISVQGQTSPTPMYLSDDVQYFPAGPQNKAASEPTAPSPLPARALDQFALSDQSADVTTRMYNDTSTEGYDVGGMGGLGGGGMGGGNGSMGSGNGIGGNSGAMGVPGGTMGGGRFGRPSGMGGSPDGGEDKSGEDKSGQSKPGKGYKPSNGQLGDAVKFEIREVPDNFGLAFGDVNGDSNKSKSDDDLKKWAIVDSSPQKPADPAAIEAKQETQWYDNGGANNLSSIVDSLKSGTATWERHDSDIDGLQDSIRMDASERAEQAQTAAVPSGTTTLGGITDSTKNSIDQSDTNTLMMTVTPRIIIPEEGKEIEVLQEAKVGILVDNYNDLIDQGKFQEAEQTAKQVAEIQPNSEIAAVLSTKARLFRRVDDYERIRTLKQEGFEDSMITLSDSPTTNDELKKNSSVSEWFSLQKNRKTNDEIANSGKADTTLERKPAKLQLPATLDEQSAATEAFSTFSLHVSDVSFKLAQTALGQVQWPEAAKIRIEEFVNALDYHDPLPTGNQKVACQIEQAIHPFLIQRNLLRVSMRTAATGRSQNTPLRLTILLDNSGSMERPDRRQAVFNAFQTLTEQLSAADQVTLISFASTPRLLADKIPGNEGAKLMQLVENLPSEGGTNIEAALLLAREKAAEHHLAGAQNRIVLLTDGAVNLGDANPESLSKLVTQMRDAAIAFDAAGISAHDLNDEVLEALTRQGDGRYYLLDPATSTGENFAAQIAGALRPSAQNVKVQVEFNPQRVGQYKLLGFEKHRLNKEDFRNDKVDAAELAAAEAGVAVYQYEIKPSGRGDIGNVSVRFRDLASGQMVERRWPILYESNTPRLEQAQASMQLAASAALFAAKLGGGPLADSVDLGQLQNILTKLPVQFASQPRVQQLRTMIDQAKTIGQ